MKVFIDSSTVPSLLRSGDWKQLATSKTPDEKTRIQRQIDATDHQINQLIYELYSLTEKEIQIVEEEKK